jgi:hypothetical protein
MNWIAAGEKPANEAMGLETGAAMGSSTLGDES